MACAAEMATRVVLWVGLEGGKKAQPRERRRIEPAAANNPGSIIGRTLDAIESGQTGAGDVMVKHHHIAVLVLFLAAVLTPATREMFVVTEALLADEVSIAELGEGFFFLGQWFVTPITAGDWWLVVSGQV